MNKICWFKMIDGELYELEWFSDYYSIETFDDFCSVVDLPDFPHYSAEIWADDDVTELREVIPR